MKMGKDISAQFKDLYIIHNIPGKKSSAVTYYQHILFIPLHKVESVSKQDLYNRAKAFAESLGMPSKTFAKYAIPDQLNSAGIVGEVDA